MLKPLPLAPLLAFAGLLAAAPALAADGWDHRAMQSHHTAVDRAPRELAPGETRVGRIEIGAVSSTRTEVPETLPTATQRQWIQRGSFTDGSAVPLRGAPRVKAGRSDGPRGSHSSGIR